MTVRARIPEPQLTFAARLSALSVSFELFFAQPPKAPHYTHVPHMFSPETLLPVRSTKTRLVLCNKPGVQRLRLAC